MTGNAAPLDSAPTVSAPEPVTRGSPSARRRATDRRHSPIPRLTAQTSLVASPSNYSASDVRSFRETLGASQKVFAELLGVSKSLVEHWEAGVRTPSLIARRLMDAVSADPGAYLHRLTSGGGQGGDR